MLRCPNCGQNNIKKAGRAGNGTQRYRCRNCGRTFTETSGTPLYRRRIPQDRLMLASHLLSLGYPIRDVALAAGCTERTVQRWIEAQQAARSPCSNT